MKLWKTGKSEELCAVILFKENMQNSKTFLLIVLGILAAFGPFVTDMYLPGLPFMTSYFKTTASMVQLGITTAMLGLAFGQIIVGPLSDKYGRRTPLLLSLWLFFFATIGCIFSWNVEVFIVFRFIQGIAGAGGIVISRSVATDCYSGKELAKAFAMISAVNGLAPIIAPIVGGVMLKFTSWQGIFFALLLLGIVLLLLCYRLKESLPRENRIVTSAFSSFRTFLPLLVKRKFMGYVWVQSLILGVIFAYISSSPFILQEHYQLSPLLYSFCFAGNAIALIMGTTWASYFRSMQKGIWIGAGGSSLLSVITALTLWYEMPILYFETALFFTLIFSGLVLPTSTTLALDAERQKAGTASAVLGAAGFLVGGIVSPLVGLGNILHSTAIVMIICSFLALGFVFTNSKVRKFNLQQV